MSAQLASRALVGAAVLVFVIGCSPVSRGVGSQPPSVTITLATPFESNVEAQPFVDAVSRLSGGSMQVAVKEKVHAGEDAIEESLLDDVAAGTYDMTWTAQRPWPARGNKAFDALVAPFLIDSYDLERAVLEDPIAEQMIGSVNGSGLVGIGVLPGPLRVIAAHKPIRQPSDLANAVVGIDDTWVGDATVKALGGTTTYPTNDNLATLTGAVAQLGAIAGNLWFKELPNVAAGIPFWPRPVIVVMNKARFGALSDDQRRVLHDSVAASIARRTDQLAAEDARDVQSLCAAASIPFASADERSAFRAAAAPVYDQLNRDPADCLVHPADRCVEGNGAGGDAARLRRDPRKRFAGGRARDPGRHLSDQCHARRGHGVDEGERRAGGRQPSVPAGRLPLHALVHPERDGADRR